MTEVLRAQPKIDVVYGHNDPMAVGAYLAAKELGREKEMAFLGVDGLGGPANGIQKVVDGDKAVEIGNRILHQPGFRPEKRYDVESTMVTPANAADLLKKLLAPGGRSSVPVAWLWQSPRAPSGGAH